ncbi:MAG: SlyX family protein [Gammaproteobacteria bacterium]|nr:SlyX family protein [Gammaproteobacteria bacterium]
MESRLTEIEIRLAHQEASLEAMTNQLLQHEKLFRDINDQLSYIKSLIKELSPGITSSGQQEIPPHY